MLIRKAKSVDINQVFLIQESVGLSYWSIEDYQNEVENPNSIFLVAEEKAIIGFILMRLITSLDVAEISNVGIKKEFQKQGIGKLFFGEIIKELKPLNIKKIELEVRQQNLQAINFYKKFHFKQDGIRKNFYQNPLDDAILMSREI
jgi:ribosomal-protein-alanine acetyltransferase